MPRLAFMGTPEFAATALRALCENGFIPAAAYTQPPRPSGRGQQLQKSPVQLYAESRSIPVFHPGSLKSKEEQEIFAALGLDLAIVAAYGLLLPKAILDAPRLGCLNIHASLLPRWRGAAPIQRAILAGDIETGICLMRMDEGLDTGPVYAEEKTRIDGKTAGELHDVLAELGAKMLLKHLPGILSQKLQAIPQTESGATYAAKIKKEEAKIDWHKPAVEIERRIRAFNPFPGAYFEYQGERIKILAADISSASGRPGEILDDGLTIACGQGALVPQILQRAGRNPVPRQDFLRGLKIPPRTMLD